MTALAFLFVIQAGMSAARKSLTIDEYTHFGAGASYVQNNYYRLNPNHPPFVKVVTGYAIRAAGAKTPDIPREDTRIAQRWYGIRWARLNAEHIERITLIGRIPHIGIALLLGLGLWLSARHFFGRTVGVITLALWATDPNVLAHARLVHTDSGAAVFVFVSVASLLLLVCNKPSWGRCTIFSVVLALALLTKFSDIVLLGVLPLVCGLWAFGVRRGYIRGGPGSGWTRDYPELRTALVRVLSASLLSVVLLALLLYRGQPHWWFYGLDRVIEHNRGGHLSFLLGEWSTQGWWYYFIVALLVKTPVPLLGLGAIGLAAVLSGLAGGKTYEKFIFVLPGFIWLVLAMMSKINIGIRHILPAYAFLFILAAAGVERMCSRRWSVAVIIALLCWQGVMAVRTFPDYIPYFNEPAGGPDAGTRYFADSNCDWGQELLTLRRYMQEQGTDRVAIHSLAASAPDVYGISVVPQLSPPSPADPAFLAIGARDHAMIMFMGTDEYEAGREFLERQEEVDRLGHSLLIYRVTEPFPRPFP